MFDIRNARQYMEKLLWIRTKEGAEQRLVLKPAQKQLMDVVEDLERQGKPVRVIVLKARQEGISTAISGYIFARCATRENRAALLVAHVADATANLYNMHLRFYDRLPRLLRPMRAASNAIELRFANPSKNPEDRAREPGLRSRIRCATAGGKGIGRSDTLQYIHASEYAVWPDGVNAKQDTLLGLLQAVPAAAGTAVFIESTAKGFDDFHKRWEDAVAGRSDFVPVFFSWAMEPGYRRPVEPGTVWSPEERELMEHYGLEPEQMAWRRWCIANNCNGDVNRFKQEYPLVPEEAFIASGACWFNTVIIMARLRELEETQGTGNGRDGFLGSARNDGTGNRGDGFLGSARNDRKGDGGDGFLGSARNDGTGDGGSGFLGSARNDGTGDEGDGGLRSSRPAETGNGIGPLGSAAPTKTGDGGAEDGARCAPPRRGRFSYVKSWDASLRKTVLSEIRFVEREDGPVTIWKEPEPRTPYVLGGDTAGEGSDWFSAYVIDNTDAGMCARIYMQHDEAEYTAQVWCMGRHYNQALIGLEVNFSTYPTRSLQEWGYPSLYVRRAEDNYLHKPRESYGWRTDGVTRPAMLAELRETVEAHPEIVCDADLLREMLVFCKDKNGRPAALEGEHDDLVMGYGITLRIREQQSAVRETPESRRAAYTEDMLEDWYAATPEQRRLLEARWGKPD